MNFMCFFRLLLIWFLLWMAVVLALLSIYCLFWLFWGWFDSPSCLAVHWLLSLRHYFVRSFSLLPVCLYFSQFFFLSLRFHWILLGSLMHIPLASYHIHLDFFRIKFTAFFCLFGFIFQYELIRAIHSKYFFIFHGLLLGVSWVNLWLLWISYPLWMNRERFNEQ